MCRAELGVGSVRGGSWEALWLALAAVVAELCNWECWDNRSRR